ncbi:LuxR C-terminal-related transcriptional regulator, partial [Streptomyces sp. NPDC057539]|uniref:LuxR C-terminal-related transcriptional regulator n=1 Tax=Streptomyces sp. NPDC057539 TaxID=3346159 RepID=UPI00367623F2
GRAHGRPPAERVSGRAGIDRVLDDLLQATEREALALCLEPGPGRSAPGLHPVQTRQALRRGVRVSVVCGQTSLEDPVRRGYLTQLQKDGVRVRLGCTASLRLAVFDRTTAVLVTSDVREALVLPGTALADGLIGLFQICWENALPLPAASTDPSTAWQGVVSVRHRAVLRMMANGVKDETVARRLGVSRRTLTRMMGEIMLDLGVENRFEAGARAARLGLLGPPLTPTRWSHAR